MQVNILLIVDISTTIIYSNSIRLLNLDGSSKTLLSQYCADAGYVYIIIKKNWNRRHYNMKYWGYQNNLLFMDPSEKFAGCVIMVVLMNDMSMR